MSVVVMMTIIIILLFVLVAIKTTVAVGCKACLFLKELGHHLYQATLDHHSYQNLVWKISVAVERGNTAAVLGPTGTDVEEFSNYILLSIIDLYCIAFTIKYINS